VDLQPGDDLQVSQEPLEQSVVAGGQHLPVAQVGDDALDRRPPGVDAAVELPLRDRQPSSVDPFEAGEHSGADVSQIPDDTSAAVGMQSAGESGGRS